MKNILIVSGHPDLNNSFANKNILEELNSLLPEAEFAYLDKLYPDFRIDIETEQKRLQILSSSNFLYSGIVHLLYCIVG